MQENPNIFFKNTYTAYDKIQAAQYVFAFKEYMEQSTPKKIDLREKLLSSNDLRVILQELKAYREVSELYLGNNNLGDESMEDVSEYIKDNDTLKILNLQNTRIGDEGLKYICKALKNNNILEHLDLYYNKISSVGAGLLAKSIGTQSPLSFLNLRYNCLNDGGVSALCELLRHGSLKKLYLGANGITNAGIKLLGKTLEENTQLNMLDLGTNHITKTELETLCKVLKKHPALNFINLERNYIGVEGAVYLAHLLENNLILKGLNLRYSHINSEGIKTLSKSLEYNNSLEELYLGGNLAHFMGSESLANVLMNNQTVRKLDLESNSLWVEGARSLTKIIRNNETLEELRIKGNAIRDEGAKIIADALKENKSIKKLCLEDNSISDEGTRVILKAIQYRNSLECNIANNSFSPSVESFTHDTQLLDNIEDSENHEYIRNVLGLAKKQLFKQWKMKFEWKYIEKISERERRNLILRAFIKDEGNTLPKAIIIKQIIKKNTYSWDAHRFLNDWTGTLFLSNQQDGLKYSPKFYGANPECTFFMLEDMGSAHISLVDYFAAQNSKSQTNKIMINFAKTLGRMHANTSTKQEEFNQLFSENKSKISDFKEHHDLVMNTKKFKKEINGKIQKVVPLSEYFLEEMNYLILETNEPSKFKGYIHADICPDNVFIKGEDFYFFDFESGRYGHILLDLACLRMNFPTCWCSQKLPSVNVIDLEDVYRKEIRTAYPYSDSNHVFYHHLALCCGFWLLKILDDRLEDALRNDKQWGISTFRQRIISQLKSFIEIEAKTKSLPHMRHTLKSLKETLSKIWGENIELPLYPSFRKT